MRQYKLGLSCPLIHSDYECEFVNGDGHGRYSDYKIGQQTGSACIRACIKWSDQFYDIGMNGVKVLRNGNPGSRSTILSFLFTKLNFGENIYFGGISAFHRIFGEIKGYQK